MKFILDMSALVAHAKMSGYETIDATQWFRNGDYPGDNCKELTDAISGMPFLTEGRIVRYYRTPERTGDQVCNKCLRVYHDHGWIDQGSQGIKVCPGDWVFYNTRTHQFDVIDDKAMNVLFKKMEQE